MKKRILSLMLGLVLVLSAGTYSFAEEIPVKPTEPEVQTEESVNEYNKEVDKYNEEVEKYNKQTDEDYAVAQTEYETQKEEVTTHNQEEQNKVEQNEKDLEKQEKVNARIEHDTNNGLENSTSDPDSAPTTFEGETEAPKTTVVEKSDAPTDIFYKLVNIHVFTEGKDYFDDTEIFSDKFSLAESLLAQAILIEWETVLANENDIVHAHSQDIMWNGQYGMFRRCLKGYTNGVWWGNSGICMSDAINHGSQYIDGSWEYYHSYNEGTDWNRDMNSVIIYWIYSFIRYGAEPEEVVKYNPDFWEEPILPEKRAYLEKLAHLIFEAPVDQEEPKEEKAKKEKTDDQKESADVIEVRELQPPVFTSSAPEPTITSATITAKKTPKNNETIIEEKSIPLINMDKNRGRWALINLILTILTILSWIVLVILNFKENRRKILPLLVGLLTSILAILVFIFTEDITLPMVLIDKWTIIMLIIFLIEFPLLFIKHKNQEEEEE